MSVLSDITALQVKHAAITGVTTSSTTYPASIDPPLLPLVMVVPDSASHYWEAFGGEVTATDRFYRVQVYVSIVNQGILIDSGLQAVITLLQNFRDAYLTNPAIDSTAFISVDEGDLTDTGHTLLEYGDYVYHGFIFRLKVAYRSTGV